MTEATPEGERAAGEIRAALGPLELPWAESRAGVFQVTLTGTRKLSSSCALKIGRYSMTLRAFVARRPEENVGAVHAWLLQHNLKLSGVAFAVDAVGDIYLVGKVPLAAVTRVEVDQLLGVVAETADSSFNVILELGFASSIAREWAWRRARGESTAHLAAFAHLDPARASLDPAAES